MHTFVFNTKFGWSYDMQASSKKDAINRFIEEVGIGVPFELVQTR